MDLQKINPDIYVFVARDIEPSRRVRWHSARRAFLNRKLTLKKFCLESGIAYPPEPGRKYVLPKNYMIEDKEVEYLARVRDNIILARHSIYLETQKKLAAETANVQVQVKNNRDYLQSEERNLRDLENNLAKSDDPSTILWLQGTIAKQTAKIKNIIDDNLLWDTLLDTLLKTDKENLNNWRKQVEIISTALDMQTNRYIMSSTKRIQKKLNYTNFVYHEEDYSDGVKRILKKDDDEKKKDDKKVATAKTKKARKAGKK